MPSGGQCEDHSSWSVVVRDALSLKEEGLLLLPSLCVNKTIYILCGAGDIG